MPLELPSASTLSSCRCALRVTASSLLSTQPITLTIGSFAALIALSITLLERAPPRRQVPSPCLPLPSLTFPSLPSVSSFRMPLSHTPSSPHISLHSILVCYLYFLILSEPWRSSLWHCARGLPCPLLRSIAPQSREERNSLQFLRRHSALQR